MLKSYRKFVFLLLSVSLLWPVQQSFAHDPGISRARLVRDENQLSINLEFASKDLEILQPLDLNRDGELNRQEFMLVKARLAQWLRNALIIEQSGHRLGLNRIHVKQAEDDVIAFKSYVDLNQNHSVSLHIPLLSQLARGHRQHLIIEDANGNLQAQYIIDSKSPALLIEGLQQSQFQVFSQYLIEGIRHIWIGFDHILFLLTLMLPAVLYFHNHKWRSLVSIRPAVLDVAKVVTAFTVAHSITLALTVLGMVALPGRLVETLIAVSVLLAALHNLRPVFPGSRCTMAFGFGLIHGFGFASVLLDLGLPDRALFVSLLAFNLGVEIGQFAIVLSAFPLFAYLRHKCIYQTWIMTGGSAVAAVVAVVWIVERVN